MRRARLNVAAAATAIVCATQAVAAGTIDIRDCPLDTLVFVDPWANSAFEVGRVGMSEQWWCPDGIEPPDISCRGPFGDTVLQGVFTEYGGTEKRPMTAIYSVIAGVPCCGWSVTKGNTGESGENFRWLEGADVPLLRDQPWLSIDSDAISDSGSDFGNPLFAAACTVR